MENTPPIKFIRNYIRDLSSIFSIPSPVSITSFPAQTVICTHFAKCQENDNTKRKTLSDLKLFKKFLSSENERREIPAAELQYLVRDKVCAGSEK